MASSFDQPPVEFPYPLPRPGFLVAEGLDLPSLRGDGRRGSGGKWIDRNHPYMAPRNPDPSSPCCSPILFRLCECRGTGEQGRGQDLPQGGRGVLTRSLSSCFETLR